ncbi:MAG: hypothetical protein L3J14_09145 [Flavobacteriaceae bacterium]|nr:hypothetical protein [Flavobacteriaceae bacterium]
MKEKATVVEMVLFKTNKGIKREEAKKAITELNEFVSKKKDLYLEQQLFQKMTSS